MPHLTGPKEEAQARLAKRLAKLTREHRREIEQLAGFPPNLDRVPETVWDRHEQEMADELAAVALLLFVLGGGNLYSLAGRRFDDETISRRGEHWATERARDTAGSFVDHSRARLETAARKTTAETTPREWRESLETVYSESRVTTVAKTETRTAVTEGEKSAAEEVNEDAKDPAKPEKTLVLTAYWHHDDPNPPPGHAGAAKDPCPICTPLLGRPLSELPAPFQSGPAGHPGCDCSLIWRDQDGNITAGRDDTDQPTIDRLPAFMKGRQPPVRRTPLRGLGSRRPPRKYKPR